MGGIRRPHELSIRTLQTLQALNLKALTGLEVLRVPGGVPTSAVPGDPETGVPKGFQGG